MLSSWHVNLIHNPSQVCRSVFHLIVAQFGDLTLPLTEAIKLITSSFCHHKFKRQDGCASVTKVMLQNEKENDSNDVSRFYLIF